MTHRLLPLTLALLLGTAPAWSQSIPDDPAVAAQRIESALADAAEDVNNRVIFNGQANDIERMVELYKPRLTPAQVERYRGQLAQYRSQYQQFANDEDASRLDSSVAELEQSWSQASADLAGGELSPNGRETLLTELRRDIERLRADQTKLADPRAQALGGRIDVVANALEQQAGAADAAANLGSLNEYWERDTVDSAGWESETPVAYATYVSTRSRLTDDFGLPKTLEIWQQASRRLGDAQEGEPLPAAFRSMLEDVQERSQARLLAAVQGLVKTAAARDHGDAQARDVLTRLDERLQVTLNAAADPQFGALAQTTQTWLAASAAQDTSSEEGKARYYEQMTVSAKAAWPEMEKQFTVVRGFDPNNPAALKGQLIRIETDNLMGWRFNTGDFPFATTLSGMPVAAIYDADVEAAINEVEAKLGRALGDDDNDGRWTVIAEVTGRMGKMSARKDVSGDVVDSSSGQKLGTYSEERAESVDAPILKIVAAHVGPLAVARGVGSARADGSLAQSTAGSPPTSTPGDASAGTASTGSDTSTGTVTTGSGVLARTPGLLLGLLAAALCWMQARPATAQALSARHGQAALYGRVAPLLPWLGVGFAVWALVWLLRANVIGDLLPALAMLAAGLYCALPLLKRRGLLAAAQVDKLQPLGLLVVAATVLTAGLHLLFGAYLLV